MFFLNLTAGEFFGLLAALGGVIAALYLLDRTKRRKIVSTLRFWVDAGRAQDQRSRKRMREPWSLILQLLGLLLLLLAAAQLQWGSRERRGRDHVLLVDTSAWSAQRLGARKACSIAKSLWRPITCKLCRPTTAVMLVSADSLAAPVTSFTLDRAALLRALGACSPGYSALNLPQALSFARQALSWAGGRAGEIVYAGPRLVAAEQNGRAGSLEPANSRCQGGSRECRHPAIDSQAKRRRSWLLAGDRCGPELWRRQPTAALANAVCRYRFRAAQPGVSLREKKPAASTRFPRTWQVNCAPNSCLTTISRATIGLRSGCL